MAMINLRDRSVLIRDSGLFFGLALRLGRGDNHFGKVGFSPIWKHNSPVHNEYNIGRGFGEIEHEPDFWDAVDNYDEIIFPDVLEGDLQQWLRNRGYRVWGAGKGEDLELFRIFAKQVMVESGINVPPYHVVKGIDNLREYLKARGECWVKISLWRGVTETFKYLGVRLSAAFLNELANTLGVSGKSTEFCIEDVIDTPLEYAIDSYQVRGEFPSIAANGVEKKDVAYAAVVQRYDDMPPGAIDINRRLAPVLRKYNGCCDFAVEIRDNGLPVAIDITARHAAPAGSAQHALWGNLPEIYWFGAEGKLIEPEPVATHVVESIIMSDRADESEVAVEFPSEYRDNVNLFFETHVDGNSTVLQQRNKMNEIGSIVTVANSFEAAIAQNKKIAEKVRGDKLHINVDKIDSVIEEFGEMKKAGFDLTPLNHERH